MIAYMTILAAFIGTIFGVTTKDELRLISFGTRYGRLHQERAAIR